MQKVESPNQPMSSNNSQSTGRICLCSPTNHPGSFRCSLHRGSNRRFGAGRSTAQLNRLGEYSSKLSLAKAFLMQIIKPSSHDLQRRRNFKPKPTRFCVMMKNNNNNTTTSRSGNQVAVS